MTQNSLSSQLEFINLSHENVIKLSNAYLEALTTNKTQVTVELENIDGTFSSITIPSNVYLANELQRMKKSLENITGLTDTARNAIVASDSSFRQLFSSSYRRSFRQPIDSDMTFSNSIKLSTNSTIENLLSPLTEAEMSISEDFNAAKNVIIQKYDITYGDTSLFEDGLSHGEIMQILAQNDFTYSMIEYTKPVYTKTSRYSGSFEVINSDTNDSNQLVIKLDTLAYSDELNVVENSKQLNVNDRLISSDGALLIKVVSIDISNAVITCEFEAGIGSIITGDVIELRSNSAELPKVRIPVRMNEYSIIFIRAIDDATGYASSRSTCKIFDSSKFIVNENNVVSTFNEYFASKVSDVGRYMDAQIRENTIPASLGITPTRPELVASNFNVVQINEHLTNTTNAKKLQKLQKEKDTTNSQLEVLNSAISELNIKISKGNYSTDQKKASDVALRTAKINEKIQKTALLSSIVADMSAALNSTAEQTITPKYRVRGFWNVQQDIPSNLTNPQKIVQYQIRYRYVANTGNTANATQMTYDADGNIVNGTFTAWSFVKTEPLERSIDSDGNVTWSANATSDADKANINQLDIPITYGESIEVQVRAVSEAGWPVNPLMSDWSALTRVDFPESLLQESDIASIARKNSEDALTVKIQQEFSNQGITEHISKSFREQDRYFAHGLDEVASTKVTPEQKQISALEYINTLENRVLTLEEIVNKRYSTLTLQILDENLRTYDINNFSTIKLFAGYYSEDVDLTEPSNYGSIVEKTFYLKLINRNAQTVEVLSISPGVLIHDAMSSSYANVPIYISGEKTESSQKNGQIFYNRMNDINGTALLYDMVNDASSYTVVPSDVDTSAVDSVKNIVHMNSGSYELVKLISSASLESYVAMTSSHPAWQEFMNTTSSAYLNSEFSRIKWFNNLFRASNVQNKLSTKVSNPDQADQYPFYISKFENQDKYLVGQNTVGSVLMSSINSIQSFQVQGIDTASSKEIYAGENDSIMIPITFQYRMTDALGNPNGLTSLTQNANFEYSKKLGFDLLLAGKKFSFDVQVSAKFRPTSISNNGIGIESVSSINPAIV